ncbi:MAG TPA: hypothetical protein VFW47_02745 [Phenylobacterium sp.]|nr:hypothetical protein [Phenylobacterium sp.]
MRTIELDASAYPTVRDFCAQLKTEIRALPGHGNSIEAFVDSMIWANGMSSLVPPYMIRVRGLDRGPVAEFVKDLSNALGQARMEHRTRRAEDVEVILQIRR